MLVGPPPMEKKDNPRPAPASKSLLRPIAGEALLSSSSSFSYSSASSPDFIRQVHATLKRRRLLTMPARAVRVPVSQTQPPKSGAAVPPQTGSNVGKPMRQIQPPIGITRFSKERAAEMGMNTRDDSSLTPPFFSGASTGVLEESMQMDYLDGDKEDDGLLGHRKETTLASFSSALLESEVVPVGDWRKKAQFSSGLGCNLSFHSAIARMTTDIGLDGIASYLHSLALTEGYDILVDRITTNEPDVNQPCSQNIDVSSSEIPFGRAFEDREEERHRQHCMEPATQSELVRSSCVTTMSIHSGPRSQSVNAPLSGQVTFPTHVSTSAAQDLCVKGHAVSETQGAVTKEGSFIDDNQSGSHLREGITVKNVITNACCLQPQAPSTSNPTSNAVMEVPRSRKAKNAPQKKKYDPDVFFKVNGKLYQKLGKIGSGGSSEVHKVISGECNIYALKTIKLKGRDYATAYGFCQEIEYLNKLKGKSNIIQLIDYEVTYKALLKEAKEGSMTSKDGRIKDDQHIYMVLEYGEIDLAHMLLQKWKGMDSSSCKLDDNWLRFYWQQMLEAVNTIHEERIVHSDLKPANFLLVRGSLKLIDFGIAKAIMSDTTNIQRDAQVGTLNYMSPESFMWNEQDESGGTIKCGRSSDIWSLGCILYQMVYGETPFAGYKTFWAKFKVITDRNYEITYKRVANPLLIDLMKRCLARDCRERWRIPQLLQHPFLLPPLMAKELPSSEDSSPELLFQRVALFWDNPEVSMLCSELQNIISRLEKASGEKSINQ